MTTLYGCQSPSVTEPQREGGTRLGFPEANEMSFGGSQRSVTEGACAISVCEYLRVTHSPSPDFVGSSLPEGAFGYVQP